MIHSLWTETAKLPAFPAIDRDMRTQVLVVGGGMAGILCARLLTDAGVECLLCEGETIGSGATAGTTAVISAQHDTLYQDLIKKYGRETAAGYLCANLEAVEAYKQMCKGIDCDYEEIPAYLYAPADKDLVLREADALRRIGITPLMPETLPLPIHAAGVVGIPGQAQFHPLKFIGAVAQGLHIREHSRIVKIKGTTAYTERYKIDAKAIVVATHFPTITRRGLYFMKMYQNRSYVLALENAPRVEGSFAGMGEAGYYFRMYKNLLLVGGGDHRTGKKGGGYGALREFVRINFPGAVEKYAWSAQDCMSLDGVPYIGPYSPGLPGVYTATGFNEWGMTSAMVAARLLCSQIQGGISGYAQVFSPSRNILCGQLFANIGQSALGLLTPGKRCSHMGCALHWNATEHAWECPCHGSCFGEDGKLRYSPATKDLQ